MNGKGSVASGESRTVSLHIATRLPIGAAHPFVTFQDLVRVGGRTILTAPPHNADARAPPVLASLCLKRRPQTRCPGPRPPSTNVSLTEQEVSRMDNKPVHEIRLDCIKAAIWANETQVGIRHNATVVRLYKDGDNWATSNTFGRDDLPLLAKVADMAHTWIFAETQKGLSTAKPNGDGKHDTCSADRQ